MTAKLKEKVLQLEAMNRALQKEITERRQVKASLRASDARIRSSIESQADRERRKKNAALLRIACRAAQMGGWTIEMPGRRLTWSDETCAIHDAPPGYLPTLEEGLELFPPEFRAEVVRKVDACIHEGVPYEFEGPKNTIKGRRIWVRSIGEALRDARGNIICLQGAFQDITERKRTQEQFFQAQRMESICTLAGGIAHDLNNVLAPILLGIELFQLDEKDPERLKLLGNIEKSARYGADLVKQVLSLARGVQGHYVSINLLYLLRDLQRVIQDKLPPNIDFRIESDPDLWKVKADVTHLHQVLMNLCVNARDAMSTGGGCLTLGMRNVVLDQAIADTYPDAEPGNYVVICVTDTGKGIPHQIRDRIFDPFFTTKEFGEGTGLGLGIVLTIIKGHGGFLTVHGEPGEGTEIMAYLPADAGELCAPT